MLLEGFALRALGDFFAGLVQVGTEAVFTVMESFVCEKKILSTGFIVVIDPEDKKNQESDSEV